MSRYLVTGAFGAIGVWTIRSLFDRGHEVVSFDVGEQAPRMAIALTPDEQRTFLADARTMTLASVDRGGYPHLVAMWFTVDPDGTVLMTTFAKSQKALNLRRDPRCTLMVERGTSYDQLQGIMIRGRATLESDVEQTLDVLTRIHRKHGGEQPEGLRDGGDHLARIRQLAEEDGDDAIAEPTAQSHGHLEREPGLPDPPRAGQGHHARARPAEHRAYRADGGFALRLRPGDLALLQVSAPGMARPGRYAPRRVRAADRSIVSGARGPERGPELPDAERRAAPSWRPLPSHASRRRNAYGTAAAQRLDRSPHHPSAPLLDAP